MQRSFGRLVLVLSLAMVLVATAPALRAENAGGPPPAAQVKYTSQTYVDVLTAEIARFKVRLERDKADDKIKTPLETAISDGDKLMAIVLDLIKAKKNLDSAEFQRAAAVYLQAKKAVPISWDDEIAHLQAWLDANKTDTAQATAVKYFENVMVLLKRGKDAVEKNNKMDAMSAQNQVNARESTADSYFKSGQYKGLGPDTHKGEYILVRLQADPNVTIVVVQQTKPDMNNPIIRNKMMGH